MNYNEHNNDNGNIINRKKQTETTGRLWKREKYRSTNQINTTTEPEADEFVSNNHVLLTSQTLPRVIVHLDADCFYAAVERVRLNIPNNVPLAVQQWTSLIAVDYNCRALGIKRGMLAEEAKKIDPRVRCVHVRLLGEKDEEEDEEDDDELSHHEKKEKKDSKIIKNNNNNNNEKKNINNDHNDNIRDRTKQKVSLSRYRSASFKVMNIFQRFIKDGDILLRASIDEAYMDLTSTCTKMMQENNNNSTTEIDMESNIYKTMNNKNNKMMQIINEARSISCVVGSVDLESPHDNLLIHAAIIVKEIRDAVQNELGYSISAGIASNKLLAKIGSSKNKPKKQTIIPHRHSPSVLANLPVKGVPGLGGKLGNSVCQFLKRYVRRRNENNSSNNNNNHNNDNYYNISESTITTTTTTSTASHHRIDFNIKNEKDQIIIKTLQYVNEAILKKEFGDSTGSWLHRISHGVDSEILTSRVRPKTLLAMKSFEPKHFEKEVFDWIETLAGEVYERYVEDKQNFKRRPTNLVLHHRGVRSKSHLEKWKNGDNNATPTCTIRTSLPNIINLTEEMIFNTGKKLFYKIEKRLPCSRIGLSMADFVDLPKKGKGNIQNAFKRSLASSSSSSSLSTKTAPVLTSTTTNWNNIDKAVLATLPEDIRKEILSEYSNNKKKMKKNRINNDKQSKKKRSIKDMFNKQTKKHIRSNMFLNNDNLNVNNNNNNGNSLLSNHNNKKTTNIPTKFDDIDTTVFAALPEDIRSELSNAYNNNNNNNNNATRNSKKKKRKIMNDDGGKQQKSLYDLFQKRK